MNNSYEMHLTESANIAWALVGILLLVIIVGYLSGKCSQKFTARNLDSTAPAPPAAPQTSVDPLSKSLALGDTEFSALSSPFYGEDNPINMYEGRLRKDLAYPTAPTIEDLKDISLYTRGHISADEDMRNIDFNSKNRSKTPRLSANVVISEHRETVSPYLGGTRSLSYAPIVRPSEARVPDKVQGPIAAYCALASRASS